MKEIKERKNGVRDEDMRKIVPRLILTGLSTSILHKTSVYLLEILLEVEPQHMQTGRLSN
jgi:hypothetical protein